MNENTFVIDQYCQKNFLDLLNDAIILAEFAESIGAEEEPIDRPEYGGWPEVSLSRSAIISSAFCLEAAANCCIASLDVGMRLKNAVEGKGIFGKFEIFLEEISPHKSLNQNKNIVDRAKEVISIRNSFAHPKVLSLSDNVESSGSKDAFPLHNLKKNFMCTYVHAVTYLKSMVNFLDYYFRDRCGYNEDQVCAILVEDTRVLKGSAEICSGGYVFQVPEFIRAKEKWELPLEFFGGP